MTCACPEHRFAARGSASEIEQGAVLMPRFGADGLIPCIVSDHASGEVVMFAHMNAEALQLTLDTGIAHYWSRSRQKLWRKGETSGHEQEVMEMRVDCDQDALWIRVKTRGTGASCHTGRFSCFYRAVQSGGKDQPTALSFVGGEPLFDPHAVYNKK